MSVAVIVGSLLWLAAGAVVWDRVRPEPEPPVVEHAGAGLDAGTAQWLADLARQATRDSAARRPHAGTDEWWWQRLAELDIHHERRIAAAWARLDAVIGARFGAQWVAEIAAADAVQRSAAVEQRRCVALAMETTGEMPRVLVGAA